MKTPDKQYKAAMALHLQLKRLVESAERARTDRQHKARSNKVVDAAACLTNQAAVAAREWEAIAEGATNRAAYLRNVEAEARHERQRHLQVAVHGRTA